MQKKPIKIIGINPGGKYIGIAVFQGHELRDWGVRVVGGKWSKRKMRKAKGIVSDLVDQYEPDVLAIKKLHSSRGSRDLDRLVDQLIETSKEKGLKVYQYSIGDVEAFFSPNERINKEKMAEIITAQYPDLSNDLDKEKRHRNPYHIRMFEAVALGSVCFHQLDI